MYCYFTYSQICPDFPTIPKKPYHPNSLYHTFLYQTHIIPYHITDFPSFFPSFSLPTFFILFPTCFPQFPNIFPNKSLLFSRKFPPKIPKDKIVNMTNGVTPRRWVHCANPALSAIFTKYLGSHECPGALLEIHGESVDFHGFFHGKMVGTGEEVDFYEI